MAMMNHRVSVQVTQSDGARTEVLEARERRIHRRLLNFLLGETMNVLVVSPGNTVNRIEIKEEMKGSETSHAETAKGAGPAAD